MIFMVFSSSQMEWRHHVAGRTQGRRCFATAVQNRRTTEATLSAQYAQTLGLAECRGFYISSYPRQSQATYWFAIAAQLSAQRRQASAQRFISLLSPMRSQDSAHRRQTSAHAPQVAV